MPWILRLIVVGLFVLQAQCNGKADGEVLEVEKLPEIQPNLPPVPTLPPPPYPIQYPDGSYSVYGLKKRLRTTIDNDARVTGFIVEVYKAASCPKGEDCPKPIAPHMWMADQPTEANSDKRLTVVGYAENQNQIDEAVAKARKGQYKAPPAETGLAPIPTDFNEGNKIVAQGRFTRISASGFNQSEGLLEYQGHTTLNVATK